MTKQNSQVPICLFISRFLQGGTFLARVPQSSEGYIIRLRVTDEQPLK